MRILLLWQTDDRALKRFYETHPGVTAKPFAEQNRLLQEEGFLWTLYLIPEFLRQGHVTDSFFLNADPTQMKWAEENGLSKSCARLEIAREQVRRHRPDVLWISSHEPFRGDFLRSIRAYCGSIVVWRADTNGGGSDWKGVDCILSSHANMVQQHRAWGYRSEQLLPCVNPQLVAECLSPNSPRTCDVSFYGSLSVTFFRDRLQFLSEVAKFVNCEIYADPIRWQRRPVPLGSFLNQFRYVRFSNRGRFHPAVFGRDVFRLIASSKIILNIHVDGAGGLAGNIRMFEATAMGALLITDASPNLSQVFEPEAEVVTYARASEAVEKIRYYLAHPNEREMIARAGQDRALRTHSSSVRAKEALAIFADISNSSNN